VHRWKLDVRGRAPRTNSGTSIVEHCRFGSNSQRCAAHTQLLLACVPVLALALLPTLRVWPEIRLYRKSLKTTPWPIKKGYVKSHRYEMRKIL
jgi:hypothetical protein